MADWWVARDGRKGKFLLALDLDIDIGLFILPELVGSSFATNKHIIITIALPLKSNASDAGNHPGITVTVRHNFYTDEQSDKQKTQHTAAKKQQERCPASIDSRLARIGGY